jgi:hypothetical protein
VLQLEIELEQLKCIPGESDSLYHQAISVPLHANKVCFGRTNLVDIILGRGTGWYLVHRFWNVSLLKQQQLGEENIVRLIRVHHPWCWMVGTGKTPEDHHYETMRRQVKKFMVLYCFSNGFPEKCGTESVVANPLFGWHFWQYLLKDVHIDIRSATLVFKNLITPSTIYAFNSRYHSMSPTFSRDKVSDGCRAKDVALGLLSHIRSEKDTEKDIEAVVEFLHPRCDRIYSSRQRLYDFRTDWVSNWCSHAIYLYDKSRDKCYEGSRAKRGSIGKALSSLAELEESFGIC